MIKIGALPSDGCETFTSDTDMSVLSQLDKLDGRKAVLPSRQTR